MGLNDVTREGVLAAMGEFDRLGRDAFLAKYGFGGARAYFLVHEGRRYDSKAIVGAAHGLAGGTGPSPSRALRLPPLFAAGEAGQEGVLGGNREPRAVSATSPSRESNTNARVPAAPNGRGGRAYLLGSYSWSLPTLTGPRFLTAARHDAR
jgi:hypothetical protein